MIKQYSPFFLLLISLTFHTGYGQTENSLIQFADLTFKNGQEKNAFTKHNETKDTTDVFDLFYSSFDISTVADKAAAIQKISNCVTYLKNEITDKTEIKKVKITYDYVHRQFLKVYKLKNSFTDIFESGEYNCVSASALYAVILTKLSIPYQIRETPEHVYLLAYPNSSKILIETTLPSKGYYQFSNSYISSFVTHLYESKIITKEEYASIPATDLFNQHYFSSKSISLLELAGLQFSNFAIFFSEDNNFNNANEEAKKAYFLFPGEKHKYLLKSTLSVLLDKNGYENNDNVNNLAILCRFNNLKVKEISNEGIVNEFAKVSNTQLIKHSDYQNFEKSYLKISNELTDTVLKNEIGFDYHYELARLGYSNSKGQDYEMEHLTAAYKLNPLNANLRTLILAAFEQALQKYNDSKSVMELANTYLKAFDFLKNNNLFLSVKANCILDLAYQSYYLSNLQKGDSYIKEFEDLVKTDNNISPTATFVEKAYSQAASEYYRKGNQSKAKQLIKSGLMFAPNSFGLQQRLNQLK